MTDTPPTQAEARMQAITAAFMTVVDEDMQANGPIPPGDLILSLAAFAAGTFEALELRTGAHRDTILRVYLGMITDVMQDVQQQAAEEETPPEEKPN